MKIQKMFAITVVVFLALGASARANSRDDKAALVTSSAVFGCGSVAFVSTSALILAGKPRSAVNGMAAGCAVGAVAGGMISSAGAAEAPAENDLTQAEESPAADQE